MIPALRRSIPGLRWNFSPRHPAVRRLVGLSGWTIGYVVSNQLALLAVYAMATGSGSGELTTLHDGVHLLPAAARTVRACR